MYQQNKAESALLAVFPTIETFHKLSDKSGSSKTIQSFIDFANRNGIITSPDQDHLETFIRQNARAHNDCIPPHHLNFEELFEKKEALLQLTLSARALTTRINALIEEHQIELPKVSNSMLTRLKKEPADTPHKQNALRSLAFWLGHDRAGLGPVWNFATLRKLCRENKQALNHKQGVRIGFALYSRGDVIEHEIVSWLKKELKDFIGQSIPRFLYGRWGKVHARDITTVYVDFPKEVEASSPASYRQCMKSAVSVAHQIAIRWALSKYYSQNRFLSIGIAAGDFASIDNYLPPLLNAKLPGDPVIRVTDYARQCLLINDIRTIFSSQPSETALFTGETLNIWWIIGFWSSTYFDFVPSLLADKLLRSDAVSTDALVRPLWFPEKLWDSSDNHDQPNATEVFFKYPHNSLLGIEIAKTLFYRRRFWEALEILRIVLSIEPTLLNARTLRIMLYRSLAIEAPSYTVSQNLFRKAEQEGLNIEETGAIQSEDFYCEYAVVYLAKAMLSLRQMRKNHGVLDKKLGAKLSKGIIFKSLDQAEALFEKGMVISPSGIRSGYLLQSIRIIKAVLENDETLFRDPDKSINAAPGIVQQTCRNAQWELGYIRAELPTTKQNPFLENAFDRDSKIHDDSISLQAYRPTTYFCTAVALWDFLPLKTVAVAQKTIALLKGAIEIARSVEKDDLCIYSYTRTYGEIMPTAKFVEHIQRVLQIVSTYCPDDLSKRDEREVLVPETEPTPLLLTLNF
jgi:hypothetical protein